MRRGTLAGPERSLTARVEKRDASDDTAGARQRSLAGDTNHSATARRPGTAAAIAQAATRSSADGATTTSAARATAFDGERDDDDGDRLLFLFTPPNGRVARTRPRSRPHSSTARAARGRSALTRSYGSEVSRHVVQFLVEIAQVARAPSDASRDALTRRLLMRYGRPDARNPLFTCSPVEVVVGTLMKIDLAPIHEQLAAAREALGEFVTRAVLPLFLRGAGRGGAKARAARPCARSRVRCVRASSAAFARAETARAL